MVSLCLVTYEPWLFLISILFHIFLIAEEKKGDYLFIPILMIITSTIAALI